MSAADALSPFLLLLLLLHLSQAGTFRLLLPGPLAVTVAATAAAAAHGEKRGPLNKKLNYSRHSYICYYYLVFATYLYAA